MRPRFYSVYRSLADPAFIGLLLIGLFLRLYALDKESLWFDEIFSIRLAGGTVYDALNAERTNPPLYFLLLHFWMQLFGSSAVATRALSVIPSVLTLPIAYVLATRLFDRRTARFALFFLCLSTFQIYYAQEVRTFSTLLFLLTASLALFERIIFSKPTLRTYILHTAITILALYSHFYAVFFVVAQHVAFLTFWRESSQKFRYWLTFQLVAGLAFLPWLLTMLNAAGDGGQQRRHLLLKLPQAFFSILASDTLIPLDEQAVRSIASTLEAHLLPLVVATFGFGYLFFLAIFGVLARSRSQIFCLVSAIVPTTIAFIISFKVMIFEERYLIAISVPLALSLSGALSNKLSNRRYIVLPAAATGAVVGVLLISLYNYYYNTRFGRDEWREAVAYADRINIEGAPILLQPDYISICYDYYSMQPTGRRVQVFDSVMDATRPENAPVYDALNNSPRIILLRSNYRDEEFVNSLKKDFDIVFEHTFSKDKGISLYDLRRHPVRSSATLR